MAQESQTGALYQPRGVGWEGDGREVKKEGDICIPVADFKKKVKGQNRYTMQILIKRKLMAILISK